jgi:PTS system ascorbate-specific IIA component
MSKVKEILKKENVRILNQVKDWREAIKVSTDPLIEQGYITENYPKRIIQLTEEHGAYYIVAKNLALVHARPEDGVLKQQLAVTVIRKPVVFDNKEDEPVQLFVTLCATDSNSHLEMLQELAEIMMDESRVEKCVQMETPEALYEEITKSG